MAPGVTQDTYGASMSGSTSAENQYIIDGLNTTGVEVGTQGKTLNFDFIQEVEVKTGGLGAEYGRMTGGAVNVITKSGGNAFHGDGFGFFEHAQASNIASQLPKTSTTTTTTPQTADYGGDLGGYLAKDKVWFFGAYDRVQRRDDSTVIRTLTAPGSPSVGTVVPLDRTSNLYSAKLTYKASQNHTLVFSMFGDPNTRDGNVFAVSGPPSTWQGTLDQGGLDMVGRYEGVFGGKTMLQVQGAQHQGEDGVRRRGCVDAAALDQTVSPTQNAGGFAGFNNQDFTRDVVKGDLTNYWGSHTIKVGGDWERVDATVNRYSGGAGQQVYQAALLRRGHLLPAPLLRERQGVRLQPDRYVDVEDCLAAHGATADDQPVVLRAGQLQDRQRVLAELRHPLGVAGRAGPRQDVGVQAEQELGAAHRLRVGSDEHGQGEDLRELGPLLREHPDGHQHPGVRRRADRVLRTTSRRTRRTSSRWPARRRSRRCSAAASSRSIRT